MIKKKLKISVVFRTENIEIKKEIRKVSVVIIFWIREISDRFSFNRPSIEIIAEMPV